MVDNNGIDEEWDNVDDADGEEVPCTTRYKAAAADEKKKMWAIFEETGFFVSTCRHSLILWFSDMIRSGELYVLPHLLY